MPARRHSAAWAQADSTTQCEIGRDQPGTLGERHERVRAHEAALAVVPADERLDADHAALVERHERLVVQHELLALERSAQAGDRRKLVGGVEARQDRRPQCKPLGVLRPVHGDVGLREELLGAVGISRIEARADAGMGVELGGRQPHGRAQRRADVLGDALGRLDRSLGIDVGDEHEELIASEPGHDVGRAHGVAEPVGDDAQELVAGRVAVAVVHELEVVEVDEEDGDRLLAAPGARDRLLEVLLEEEAVGQVGERVVIGEVGEPGLRGGQLVGGAAAVGHVGRDAVNEAAAILCPRPGALPHPAGDAVEADQAVLELAGLTALQRVAVLLVVRPVVGVDGGLPRVLLVDAVRDRADQARNTGADELVAAVAAVVEPLHLVDVDRGCAGDAAEDVDGVAARLVCGHLPVSSAISGSC